MMPEERFNMLAMFSRNGIPKGVNEMAGSSSDLDQAYWYVEQPGLHKDAKTTTEQLRRLRRKIDWRIVPIMVLCYTMQFIDKVSLNVRNLFKMATI